MCHNPVRVCDKSLGAPASVKLVYWQRFIIGYAVRPSAVMYFSTDRDSQERMSGQILASLAFHENEAIHADKSSDDEPPCRNVLANNNIVITKASRETVSELSISMTTLQLAAHVSMTSTQPSCLHLEMVSRTIGNGRYDIRLAMFFKFRYWNSP